MNGLELKAYTTLKTVEYTFGSVAKNILQESSTGYAPLPSLSSEIAFTNGDLVDYSNKLTSMNSYLLEISYFGQKMAETTANMCETKEVDIQEQITQSNNRMLMEISKHMTKNDKEMFIKFLSKEI